MHRCLLYTPRFAVEHRVFERPNRSPLARDVVVHPGAVVILPLLDESRIVMIRNYRYTVERELWELPAGTLEPGEPPLDAARRELEEESGYRAAALTPFAAFYTSPGVLTERMSAFVASDLTHVGQKLETNERIQAEVVELETIRHWLAHGELVDGKTIAVLATYLLQQHQSD